MKEKKARVYIEKTTSADRPDRRDLGSFCENPYHRDNVNVAMGPRQGNEGAHSAKRGNFKAAKAERLPLAEEIMKAFGEREIRDYEEHEFPESGAIDSNSHVRRFRSSRQKG